MAEEITLAKKNNLRNFRIYTASTKVTQSELAELERAAAERGIHLANGSANCSIESFATVTR
jgi:hypothetical protein